jgi:predicted RND superfamily exporter protein
MHLCEALPEKLTQTESAEAAVIHTFMGLILSTFLAVITTIIGLTSLLINRISDYLQYRVFEPFFTTFQQCIEV